MKHFNLSSAATSFRIRSIALFMCYTSHLCLGCFMLLNPTRVVLLINKCRHGDDIKMAVIVLLLYTCDYSAVATFPPSFLPFLPPVSHQMTEPSHPTLSSFVFSSSLLPPPSSPHTPTYHTAAADRMRSTGAGE